MSLSIPTFLCHCSQPSVGNALWRYAKIIQICQMGSNGEANKLSALLWEGQIKPGDGRNFGFICFGRNVDFNGFS